MSHEVGHQFGLSHACGVYGVHNHKWLMAGLAETENRDRDQSWFSPVSLDRMRSIDHPIQDE
jgi:hypothetical protein